MEKSLEELGRRVIVCKNWRWMEGMNAITPDGLSGCRITPFTLAIDHYMLPDLTDPATLGCLVDLVRKAYDNKVVISIGNDWWSVETDLRYWDQDNTDSFLRAIVFALESANE
jgi:hypothetical protein